MNPKFINTNPKKRNDALFDVWSLVHIVVSAVLAVLFAPFIALVVVVLWEPVENFIISPLLAKLGITFGHESLKNVLSDIVFNIVGIFLAIFFFAA